MALTIPAMVGAMLLHFDEYAGRSASAAAGAERTVNVAT
jgi:hypothetical protein